MSSATNRRISERVLLNPHMGASMTPISKCGDSVKESYEVCVLDIGIDGLRFKLDGLKFKTNFFIESNEEVIFTFEVPNNESSIVVQGNIVHSKNLGDTYEYGVELFMNDTETDVFLDFIESIIHDKLPELGIYSYKTCQCKFD